MTRDYTPLPLEYLEEMKLLTDEEFGRLCRALLRYAGKGEKIELDDNGRFYAERVMHKDDYYYKKAAEEEEKKLKKSESARKAVNTRYHKKDTSECADEKRSTNVGNIKTIQNNTNQNKSNQYTNIVLTNNVSPEAQICATVCTLMTVEKTEFSVSEEDVALWSEAFPALDVRQKLGEMKAWLDANPKNRKTEKGMKRFIVNWLTREQNRARPEKAAAKAKPVKEFIPTEF